MLRSAVPAAAVSQVSVPATVPAAQVSVPVAVQAVPVSALPLLHMQVLRSVVQVLLPVLLLPPVDYMQAVLAAVAATVPAVPVSVAAGHMQAAVAVPASVAAGRIPAAVVPLPVTVVVPAVVLAVPVLPPVAVPAAGMH